MISTSEEETESPAVKSLLKLEGAGGGSLVPASSYHCTPLCLEVGQPGLVLSHLALTSFLPPVSAPALPC